MSVSLVPAYEPCTAQTHARCAARVRIVRLAGPDLAAPDDRVARRERRRCGLVGSVRFDVKLGNSATEANEADVRIRLNVNDVRCYAGDTRSVCGSANTFAGRDYTGGLRVRFGLRLTDRYNLPSPRGNLPGTVSDTPVEINLPSCVGTPGDPVVGSTCSITTAPARCWVRPRTAARSCSSGRSRCSTAARAAT